MMAIRPRDYGSRFIKTARWFSLRKPRLPIWRWTGLNAAKKVTFSGGKARGATFGCGITHYGFVISNIPLVPSRIVLEIDWRGLRLDEDTWSVLVKIVWHDGIGMSLYAKRLERGRFIWPSPADGIVAISAAQLAYMLDRIDWRNPVRTWRPEVAG